MVGAWPGVTSKQGIEVLLDKIKIIVSRWSAYIHIFNTSLHLQTKSEVMGNQWEQNVTMNSTGLGWTVYRDACELDAVIVCP